MQAYGDYEREVKIGDYDNFKKVKHGVRASVHEGRAAARAIALHIRLAAEREKAVFGRLWLLHEIAQYVAV